MTIRTIIVDDDQKPRALLHKALRQHFPHVEVIAECHSVDTAVEAIRRLRPDLVFLDVDLTYGTGFDVLDALDKHEDPDIAVIFVTAFAEYAIKAIEYSAVGYIMKPINNEEFQRKVQKTLERLFPATTSAEPTIHELPKPLTSEALHATESHAVEPKPVTRAFPVWTQHPLADKITLPSTRGKQLVALKDVLYCEAQSNYTEFHLAGGTCITVAKTLKEYEAQLLPKGFFRIHRSHLINIAHLREVVREGNSLFVRLQGVQRSFSVARMFHESLFDMLP